MRGVNAAVVDLLSAALSIRCGRIRSMLLEISDLNSSGSFFGPRALRSRQLMADVDYLEQWVLLAIRRLHPIANASLVREEIEKRTGRTYGPGNIHVVVHTLKKKGFIEVSPPHEPTTGRVRKNPKIINLTEQGLLTLEQWLRAIDALR